MPARMSSSPDPIPQTAAILACANSRCMPLPPLSAVVVDIPDRSRGCLKADKDERPTGRGIGLRRVARVATLQRGAECWLVSAEISGLGGLDQRIKERRVHTLNRLLSRGVTLQPAAVEDVFCLTNFKGSLIPVTR